MQEEKDMKKDNDEIVDEAGLNVSGHILIRDKESGEELVNKRNAIHYGNMARVVALALSNADNEYINFIAYGSGGTTVDTSGKVIYKNPRVSESYDASGSLYNRTHQKSFTTQDDSNKIEVIQGASYSDLKITSTLGYAEPSGQELFDTSTDNEGDYVFDELGLFTNATDINDATMLTHVIFHPVQKSQNRIIEIVYTVRIQLS
jgi:hypothetical protein